MLGIVRVTQLINPHLVVGSLNLINEQGITETTCEQAGNVSVTDTGDLLCFQTRHLKDQDCWTGMIIITPLWP